jgi:hypothetical protein
VHVARVRERAKRLGAKTVQFDEPTRTLRILMPSQDEQHFYAQTFPLILDRFAEVGQNNIRLVSEGKLLRLVVRTQIKEDGEERLKEIEEIIRKLTPEEMSQL